MVSSEELEKRRDLVSAILRWVKIRYYANLDADPRKAPWWDESDSGRRGVVFRAIETWMEKNALSTRTAPGKPESWFEGATRFEIDLEHSALLEWLLQGNEPLPYPPPVRFSRPDHRMALFGEVKAHEVWRDPERGIDACVDQRVEGWKYVSGSAEEGVFVFDQERWGTWRFQKVVETRGSASGREISIVSWLGKRI